MRRRQVKEPLEIAVILRSRGWRFPGAAVACRRAARAAVEASLKRHGGRWLKAFRARGGEIGILLAGDAYAAKLNRSYRGRKGPTNVLSFPGEISNPSNERTGVPLALGDLVIAYGVTASEAKRAGRPLAHHLAHLVVHGVLHLLGYDHEREREALRMETLEIEILCGLGIPDPYREILPAEVA